MKFRSSVAAIALTLGFGLAGQAFAGTVTVFSNPVFTYGSADCSFSTTCASMAGRGDDFAGQAFTLSSAQSINAASFTELDFGGNSTAANWAIYQADGAGALPGTLVASGSNAPLTQTPEGNDIIQENFGLGTNVSLASGSYYFAVQAVSPTFTTFLMQGLNGGAVETHDGGASWSSGYESMNGVAVGLYDVAGGVPEPSTWVMLLLGVAAIGAAMRAPRRREGLVAAA